MLRSIPILDQIQKDYRNGVFNPNPPIPISPLVYRAYLRSKEYGYDYIDFVEAIFNHDVYDIVSCLKRLGVTTFTISSQYSNLIALLYLFCENGCTVEKTIKCSDVDCWGDTHIRYALKMHIKKESYK